jgi:hypothetical protein
MKSILAAATILSALAVATAAHATLITETYDFTASGFLGGGAPVDPWTGEFTITFDPTIAAGPSPVTSFTSNLPATYTKPVDWATDGVVQLSIGTDLLGGDTCRVGPLDFCMFINVTNPASPLLTFAVIGVTAGDVTASTRAISVAPAAVPEPQTLLLFGSALGLFGITRRRFRR